VHIEMEIEELDDLEQRVTNLNKGVIPYLPA
jgi:hypothetical protein